MAVEEGALSGVGVADQRDRGHGNGLPAFALQTAYAADRFQLAAKLHQAALDLAAIGFKLRFTRAACADATASLRHGQSSSSQARQHVFELGKLNLQLALAGAGVTGEYVEDELRTVHHAARKRILKISLLRGAEVVIKKNERRFRRSGDGADLVHLAAAHERSRVGLGTTLNHLADDFRAGTGDQFAEFVESGLGAHFCRRQPAAVLRRSGAGSFASEGCGSRQTPVVLSQIN